MQELLHFLRLQPGLTLLFVPDLQVFVQKHPLSSIYPLIR